MCLGQSGGLRCVCILKAVLYKACTRLIKVPLEFRSLYCFAARVYRTHISRYQLTAHVHTCVLTYGGTVYHVINERLLSPRDRPDGCRCRAASLGVSTQPTPPYTFGQLLCPVILYFIALLIAVLSGHSCATTPCRGADLSALSRLRVQHARPDTTHAMPHACRHAPRRRWPREWATESRVTRGGRRCDRGWGRTCASARAIFAPAPTCAPPTCPCPRSQIACGQTWALSGSS